MNMKTTTKVDVVEVVADERVALVEVVAPYVAASGPAKDVAAHVAETVRAGRSVWPSRLMASIIIVKKTTLISRVAQTTDRTVESTLYLRHIIIPMMLRYCAVALFHKFVVSFTRI